MSILWTLLASFVRFWAWTAHRSAAKWAARHDKAEVAAKEACKQEVKGTEANIEKHRAVGRLMDQRDRAERKWTRKAKLATRLEGIHNWLSRPRTIAGWVAGATALPATGAVAWLGGVDVPGLLVWAGGQLQALTTQ